MLLLVAQCGSGRYQPPGPRTSIYPQCLPVEYGGKNTVPVFDSAEERHLRRLVDAINANAEKTPSRDKKANGHNAAAKKSEFNNPCKKHSQIQKDTARVGSINETVEKTSDFPRTPQGRVSLLLRHLENK